MPRIYRYGDQTWAEPEGDFTIQDVQAQLATFLPELANASFKKKTLPNGDEEIEFVKRSGTKGLEIAQFPLGTECPFCGEPIDVSGLPDGDCVVQCPYCSELVRVIRHVSTWFALDECEIGSCDKVAT